MPLPMKDRSSGLGLKGKFSILERIEGRANFSYLSMMISNVANSFKLLIWLESLIWIFVSRSRIDHI